MNSRNMAKKQHEIFKRQNEPALQLIIVAQHYTYTNAKCWAFVLFFVLVVLPVGINIALFFSMPDLATGLLALLSFVLLVFGELIRNHIQKEKRYAAMLQQKFDTYVFDINSQYGIDENIIAEQLEKYKKKDWERKQNWYQNYEYMNKQKAIFYCQKENVDWTNNISKRYCKFLLAIVTILLLSFVVNCVINNSSIIKILSILVAALPLISYGFTSYKKIRRDNIEMAEIDKFVKEINSNIDTINETELSNKINVLQTMIFKFRQTKYLIPDWFENKYRKHLQAVEARKAGQRIALDKRIRKKR